MKLKIPESHRNALRKLFALDKEARAGLVRALQKAAPALSPSNLAESISAEVKLDKQITKELVAVFAAMYWAKDARRVPLDEFVEYACDAIRDLKDETIRPPDGDWTYVKGYLKTILSFEESLGVSAKAMDVMAEHANTYCKARVLTDIRPVFKSDVSAGPAAAVIVQTLKLRYHRGDEMSEFFLAMDSEDMAKLRSVLDRAEAKAAALRGILAGSGTPYIDVPHGEG